MIFVIIFFLIPEFNLFHKMFILIFFNLKKKILLLRNTQIIK